ncbi:IS200/IS605 family accessory protein TnpB-related protein [Thermus caliditerrae]|uniref:IS200/IS605 family accessory protein TnpB-related protein n=1 Tax=Thermus caliditerrae TaxID=1330700 RepID=UPI00056FF59D|nr:IS200/IS605 family accessory protein TnpB-related protein [Thermus caliditerrae]
MKRGKKKRKKREPKPYTGLEALLLFPDHGDYVATLDLMRRFSSAVRYGYKRRLEGEDRKALKKEDGPLCTLFRLNTRYADDALLKAEALLTAQRELGENPRKVVFGGRKLLADLARLKRSNLPLYERKKAEWRERRKGTLYARGDRTKGGNLNLRLVVREGSLFGAPTPQMNLWLRVNLGDRYAWALVKTSHPRLQALLSRVYAHEPYNVELSLREGKVYALFSWEEELPPISLTQEGGVLALDVNADPYHLALAVVNPDGSLRRHLTLSLEEVDRAKNRGAKEISLWRMAHQIVSLAQEEGVAIATERLKHLPKGRRGDGSGRRFRRQAHRFAYRSLLGKVHALARRRGIQSLEVNPQDTSTIGMLKYAPLLSLSKDVAAAYVIGRRALGFKEKIPKPLKALLQDPSFHDRTRRFYEGRIAQLKERHREEKNPYLKRKLRRELAQMKRALATLPSLQGEPGGPAGSTAGRNPQGIHAWRALRVGLFLPLLGQKVPRDLSARKIRATPVTKPILLGSWEGWKGGLDPHPGGGSAATDAHLRVGVGSGG